MSPSRSHSTAARENNGADAPGNGARTSRLTRLIRYEALRNLQERFARLAQVSVCICDVNGEPITAPTWGSQYSRMVGTSVLGGQEWRDGLTRVCREPGSPAPVTLHDGMTLYAAPMMHNHERLGMIVVGTRPAQAPSADVLRRTAAKYGLDAEAFIRAAEPEFAWTGGTPEAIRQFADLLAATIATLYGQADRIGQQLADLRVVHRLSDLLAGTLDLQQILNLTVRQVVEVMSVKACAIRLLNETTGELVLKAVHNLSQEYLQKGPVLLHENRIDATAFAGHAVYIEDAGADPRMRYPEHARREGLVSGLSVPMTFRGQTIGVIRVYTGQIYRFTDSEIQLLRSIGSQAAAAIITHRLFEGRAAAERVQRQVEAAGQIQRRMLPARPIRRAGLDVGCVYDPTLLVGGDFYDFLEWPDGSIGVCIADVVGKGLPAALMMASVRASLRAHACCVDCVGDIIQRVNRDLCRDALPSEFATIFLGIFSPDLRQFTYCNAGHVPTLLLRDGQFMQLEDGGLVIGLRPNEEYEIGRVVLQKSDTLFFLSDGVTEAFNFDGVAYGWDRLYASILRHQSLSAEQLTQQILWDVRRFAGLADQSDDITIAVARVA